MLHYLPTLSHLGYSELRMMGVCVESDHKPISEEQTQSPQVMEEGVVAGKPDLLHIFPTVLDLESIPQSLFASWLC